MSNDSIFEYGAINGSKLCKNASWMSLLEFDKYFIINDIKFQSNVSSIFLLLSSFFCILFSVVSVIWFGVNLLYSLK